MRTRMDASELGEEEQRWTMISWETTTRQLGGNNGFGPHGEGAGAGMGSGSRQRSECESRFSRRSGSG